MAILALSLLQDGEVEPTPCTTGGGFSLLLSYCEEEFVLLWANLGCCG